MPTQVYRIFFINAISLQSHNVSVSRREPGARGNIPGGSVLQGFYVPTGVSGCIMYNPRLKAEIK